MTGKYEIIISNKKLKYILEAKRKFTVIRGDSAKGKTAFADMVDEFNREGTSSGVALSCRTEVIRLNERNWQYTLNESKDKIFVIDENDYCIKSVEFYSSIMKSDNYFIIISREEMTGIPYSIMEIYTLKSDKKYNNLNKMYYETTLTNVYNTENPKKPNMIITEDSNSGYEFFNYVTHKCVSANGNSNVMSKLKELVVSGYDNIAVIVDGAAFGGFIDSLTQYVSACKISVTIFAPESFEYLVLKALPKLCNRKYLENTYDYCDTVHLNEICCRNDDEKILINSWEQFYTRLLIGLTHNTPFQYTKSNLNENILNLKSQILEELPELM